VDRTSHQLQGRTTLSEACAQGHASCARLLLEHGAAVDVVIQGDGPYSTSPAFEATPARLLVDHSADMERVSWSGAPALFAACALSREGCAALLARRGARIREDDRDTLPWLAEAARLAPPFAPPPRVAGGHGRGARLAPAPHMTGGAPEAPTPAHVARQLADHPEHGSKAALVLRVAEGWCPETHALFPKATRERVWPLLRVGAQLARRVRAREVAF